MSSLRIGVLGVLPTESGGAGTLTQRMLLELIESSKHDSLIYISDSKNLFKRFFAFLRDIFISNSMVKFFADKYGVKLCSSLDRKFIKDKLDLVFFFSYNPKAELINFTPFVVSVWDLGHLEYPFLVETGLGKEFIARENYYQSVLKRAYSVLVESEHTRNALKENYGIRPEKILVMPFAPEVPSCTSMRVHEGYLFYPSHYWSHKNHVVLLRALRLAKQRYKGYRKLVFSGLDKGNLGFLSEFILEHNLDDDVIFAGFLSADDLEHYFQGAYAILYPSILGPTNLPPLEALLRNRPVIASSISVVGMPSYPFTVVANYNDPESWIPFFDSSKNIEFRVDPNLIQNKVHSIRDSNIASFSQLLFNLRQLKMLSTH